ncbi:MAG TPA: hypothetical protein VFY27_07005 [Woeseiaceae bacterium]|nr:hypothetical protein [Woeseiaceae bacterium]
MPNVVQTSPDDILVGDARAGKLVRFGADMEFRGTALVASLFPTLAAKFARIDPMGITPDGTPIGVARDQDSVRWYVGDSAAPLVSIPAGGGTGRARIADGMLTFVQPFREDPIIIADPGREVILKLDRGSDSLYLEIRSTTDESSNVRHAISSESRPIPAEVVSARIDSFAAYYQGRGIPMDEVRSSIRAAMHVPERSHGVAGIFVSGDSLVAITHEGQGSERSVARVFRYSTGEAVGEFEIPPRSRLVSFSRGHVWLLQRDQHDVEYLVKRTISMR